MHIWLILGYGIPKKMEQDENYQRYLGVVFNTIFEASQRQPGQAQLVILSGGLTDCFKPYRRGEASEIARVLKIWAARPECRRITAVWKFLLEKKSLSTLENFLFTAELLKSHHPRPTSLTVFGEHIRGPRILKLARKFFPGIKVRVIPVDFDTSANRYLDPKFLKEKEVMADKVQALALQSPENFKKIHKLLADRIRFLRQAGGKRQVEAVRAWWEKALEQRIGIER